MEGAAAERLSLETVAGGPAVMFRELNRSTQVIRMSRNIARQMFRYGLLILCVPGCAGTGGNIKTTMMDGETTLPKTIAVYPLLTSTPKEKEEVRFIPLGESYDKSKMYITPPADFTLSITLDSQMMSDALTAELANRGFSLKQLPVVIPEDNSQGEDETSQFAVSLELLDHMRQHMNLEAILIGNVLLVPNRNDPSNPLVKKAYLKLIDVSTLNVLCTISVSYGSYAGSMEDVVDEIAEEMGRYLRTSHGGKSGDT